MPSCRFDLIRLHLLSKQVLIRFRSGRLRCSQAELRWLNRTEQGLFFKRPQWKSCWPAERAPDTAGVRSRPDGRGPPAYLQPGWWKPVNTPPWRSTPWSNLPKDNHAGNNTLQRCDGAFRPRLWPPSAVA